MKTDEGTTEQVPDRSASAGTGYWLRRVVVNGGGRQMPRRAGDDLCGAVRVEGGASGVRRSSGSRWSRCRCPSNDGAGSGTCCRFLALTMWSCVRRVHVTLYVIYVHTYDDDNNNNIIKTTVVVGIYLPATGPATCTGCVHRPCHLRLPTRSRQRRRRWRSGVQLRKAEEVTEKL